MDAVTVALVAAIVTLAVGVLTAAVNAWSVHRTAKTAREGRIEQRRAEAYLQVLSIVGREDTGPRLGLRTSATFPTHTTSSRSRSSGHRDQKSPTGRRRPPSLRPTDPRRSVIAMQPGAQRQT
jgi:hypothetical protein